MTCNKIKSELIYEVNNTEGVQAPSKDIIEHPDLQIYVADFGKKDDLCYVADFDGKVVGAVWTRIINDY